MDGSPASPRALLLVDHGSVHAEANELLHAIAARVASLAPDLHVTVAHMELASPSIQEGIACCVAAGAKEIIVHPYMLGPGRHSTADIPRLAREAAARHPGVTLRFTEPLGADDRLAEVVLARVRESLERR